MTDQEKRQEILRLFDQLTPEEKKAYVAEVTAMLIENHRSPVGGKR